MLKTENKKSLIINLICFFLYAAATLAIVLRHEIWADEAQVWLIVKNLGFVDLFKHLVLEGHPALFYLLMMPFAKMNVSIFFMQIFCWLCSCAGVFLLLTFAPFNRITKCAIITGAGFLYFFPVIARSYSLLPLLIFILAVIYKDRLKHPLLFALLLALIANTHVIMFGFVFITGLFFLLEIFKEKKLGNSICTSAIIITGLLAVVIQLWGTENANSMINFSTQNIWSSCIIVPVQFFVNAVEL